MRMLTLGLCGFIVLSFLAGAQQQRDRTAPGLRKAMEKQRLPIEPPLFQPQRSPVDIAQLKRDAEELAKLAQAVPTEIEQVTQGLYPKDLDGKLKRIERLCKRLRDEISP